MTRLPDDFHQDLALRDAARDVLMADVAHVKATMNGKALAGRVTSRIGDGAKDVLEVAKVNASDRQGLIAGIIAIIALWFARAPLMEIVGSVFGQAEGSDGSVDSEASEADEPEENDGSDEAALDPDQGETENPAPQGGDTDDIKTHLGSVTREAHEFEPLSTGETA